eukprot:352356-Chlamydomonas_euryale.AAC.3
MAAPREEGSVRREGGGADRGRQVSPLRLQLQKRAGARIMLGRTRRNASGETGASLEVIHCVV